MSRRGSYLVVALVLALLPGAAHTAEDGECVTRHDYVLHCAGCHKFDGTGSARIPDLHGLAEVVGRLGWREYVVRVPGVAQAPLSDARLARLLDYLMIRFAETRPEPPFTAAEVGRARTEPFRDPIGARAALLSDG